MKPEVLKLEPHETMCERCTHWNICKAHQIGEPFISIRECHDFEARRKSGKWIPNTRYNRKNKRFYDCSICHYGENGEIICEVAKIPLFCPNCGAQMEPPC